MMGWLAGPALKLSTALSASARLDRFEFSQVHMGVPVAIRLYSEDAKATPAAAAAFARIAVLDRMMSDYRPDSELARLEANGRRRSVVSAELFEVLERAVEIARASGGAFDPTIKPVVALWREARLTRRLPDRAALASARASVGWRKLELDRSRRAVRLTVPGMRLDLGGIAKGYILQQALQTLAAHGVTRALIEGGGDIAAGEPPPGREGWRVEADGADATFQERAARLRRQSLATSGPTAQFVEIDGVRYSHVVDPRTGLGLTNSVVAQVIADDGATALATALTVFGQAGAPALLARFPRALASVHRERREPVPLSLIPWSF
jgi:thiamine biosynthesis lipoprotein